MDLAKSNTLKVENSTISRKSYAIQRLDYLFLLL